MLFDKHFKNPLDMATVQHQFMTTWLILLTKGVHAIMDYWDEAPLV